MKVSTMTRVGSLTSIPCQSIHEQLPVHGDCEWKDKGEPKDVPSIFSEFRVCVSCGNAIASRRTEKTCMVTLLIEPISRQRVKVDFGQRCEREVHTASLITMLRHRRCVGQ
jgi:hypothetical protein